MAMIESHFLIEVATRTDKPLEGFGPHWVAEFSIELPRGITMHAAAFKKKELEVLLNPGNGRAARRLQLVRVQCEGAYYTEAELDACHVTGKWPTKY